MVCIGYTACKKSALTLSPPLQTSDVYFKSENDFRTAIIGVYAAITDFYSSSSSGGGSGSYEGEIQLLPGDDLTNNNSEPYEIFTGITPDDGKISQYFKSCYILIGRANLVLQKVQTAPPGTFTTPNMSNYVKGEALFLRAFGHYQLWNVYGTAPVSTTIVTSLNDLSAPSSKGTELLDQAINDLNAATTLLPVSWDSSNLGRVTANAAYGMLGKCLVFRATVNKNNADYQAAIEAFGKISGASLVPNFEDNFNANTENNSESLFEFQAGVPLAGAGNTNAWLNNDQANIGVASAYWHCFGEGNFTSYMSGGIYTATSKLLNAFDPADPRLPLTINTADNTIQKYILNDKPEGAANSLNNPRILRYADVKLLWAEALLKSGGSTKQAIDLINDVRTRARNMVSGGTIPANYDDSTTDTATIFNWIVNERFVELAGEGQRWYDLRRWALAGEITLDNNFFNSVNPTKMAYDAHFLNFPIPSSETGLDKNIVQNPGY